MSVHLLKKTDIHQFIEFNNRVYPKRKGTDQSIYFKLNNPYKGENPDQNSFIVDKDSNGQIIGQIQRLPCRYHYHDEILSTFWGMDYIVEKKYRGETSGVYLAMRSIEDSIFGIGLSPISYAINIKLGLKHMGHYEKRIWFRSIFHAAGFTYSQLIMKPTSQKFQDTTFPEQFQVGRDVFARVTDYSLIHWKTTDSEMIEFVRDEEFLNWRFGSYPQVFALYAIRDRDRTKAYFVVRKVCWKGSPFLLIVDYRYTGKYIYSILRAAKILAKKANCMGAITLSSINLVDKALRQSFFWKFGQSGKIVSNVEYDDINRIQNRHAVMVTFADSDADMFFGNKEWYE